MALPSELPGVGRLREGGGEGGCILRRGYHVMLLLLSTGDTRRKKEELITSQSSFPPSLLDSPPLDVGWKTKAIKGVWSLPAGSQVSYFPPPLSTYPPAHKSESKKHHVEGRFDSGWCGNQGPSNRALRNVGIREEKKYRIPCRVRRAARIASLTCWHT